MGKELALPKDTKLSKEKQKLLGKLKRTDTLVSGGGSFSKKISIRGSVFRKIVDGKEIAKIKDRELNIAIIDASDVGRTYYDKEYVEGEEVPPKCWSTDSVRPSEQVAEQDRMAAKCDDCPMNIKGSGQGDSRKCRFQQRLAVMLDGAIGEGADIYQLVLPSKSLFGNEVDDEGGLPLRAYGKFIRAQDDKLDVCMFLTRAMFDADSSTPKLTFKAERYLEDDELQGILWAQEQEATNQAMEMSFPKHVESEEPDKDVTADKKKEKKKKKKESKAALPAPEASEEPTVRKKKKEKPKANEDRAKEILDDWDD